MGKSNIHIIDIPLEELENMEEMFFRQIQMERRRVMKKFSQQYNVTRHQVMSGVTAEGMFRSVKIEKKEEENIYLEGGTLISSRMLSELFKSSDEIIVCAMTLHGYDQLEAESDDNLITLFLDGWGTAAAECGHVWMKEQIRGMMEKKGRYLTSSWSPGQHNIDIKLQKEVFELLQPEEIGMELTDSFMMHPKKSISSFIGIGSDENAGKIRACDFCERRETCPSAYV